MQYISTTEAITNSPITCLCLPVANNAKLPKSAGLLSEGQQQELQQFIEALIFSGKAGETLFAPRSSVRDFHVLLVGMGESEKLNSEVTTKAAKSIASALGAYKIVSAGISLDDFANMDGADTASILIEAIETSHYRFDTYKSEKADAVALKEFTFFCKPEAANTVEQTILYSQALSHGRNLARSLGNEPGNVCTPQFLADTAIELGQESPDITTHVLVENELEAMGMGAFVSVSKGSTLEGCLITMEYKGGNEDEAPYVFVGKGITFDTGGISLKPGPQMDEMKYDMCGAASVLGLMKAVAELKPKLNVVGVVAAAENMPAGNASKPGDIVKTLSGQTVEILNTDAEGRLVLCDALTYVEKFKPAAVVDIATLTGACIVALGHNTSAVMGNNQPLVDSLLTAGTEAQDKAWQLPIWDEYQTLLDSPFADMQNIGGKGAGSITAACFLSRYTKAYPWAHLDVAGTAWVSGGKEKGATGRPVPLLMRYLMNQVK